MTLSITNPFSKPPINPIQFGSLAAKQSPPAEETMGSVASNPIKTMNAEEGANQIRRHDSAMSNYGIAMVAMQNKDSVGAETTGAAA
ncbi:MAG: hypothetical protein AB7V50_07065 [Vampirovibrionia bacterium]